MTVKELRDALANFDDDLLVVVDGGYRIDNVFFREISIERILGFTPENIPQRYEHIEVVSIE